MFIPRLILNAIADIWNSFKDDKGGLGARRLTTFGFMLCVVYLHRKYSDKAPTEFLIIDCIMILLLLAILTTEKLIEILAIIKDKKENKPTENTQNENI
jgi:hypothetical protein